MPGEKLAYSKQEPEFLRKLREQHGGPRNNVQIARPKKDRLKTGHDDEDDPVIVDEAGENVEKAEWEEMLEREKDGNEQEKRDDLQPDSGMIENLHGKEPAKDLSTAGIGVGKKRKAVKVVGGEDDGVPSGNKPAATDAEHDVNAEKDAKESQASSKAKKKAKKIKLSFDEGE